MKPIARTPKQIGDIIRRQRKQLGWSQSQLGERTQLRQATISAVEQGEPGTQVRTLCDILSALDLELVIGPRSKADPNAIEDIF